MLFSKSFNVIYSGKIKAEDVWDVVNVVKIFKKQHCVCFTPVFQWQLILSLWKATSRSTSCPTLSQAPPTLSASTPQRDPLPVALSSLTYKHVCIDFIQLVSVWWAVQWVSGWHCHLMTGGISKLHWSLFVWNLNVFIVLVWVSSGCFTFIHSGKICMLDIKNSPACAWPGALSCWNEDKKFLPGD